METRKLQIPGLVLIAGLLLSACSGLSLSVGGQKLQAPASQPAAQTAPTAMPVVSGETAGLVAAYEGSLEQVYQKVNPSVVNIRVVSTVTGSGFGSQGTGTSQALGSGFVWDPQGHIVTNNHVVDGADKIEVTLSTGKTLSATLVGADSTSDLAVIKVDAANGELTPLELVNSEQVKVGQLAVAIGNPFGLSGSMTVGIISALNRSLPVDSSQTGGPSYSIPNVIQTDAVINPGNSGGVLVDINGQVIGVTAAIESSTRSNSGVGFVIPSSIVQEVVPQLINTGKYEHAWLGITGTSLTTEMAKAMNLSSDTRGALVVEVASGGPAENAGLKASADTTTVDGVQVPVGGDVITALNGQPILSMDDLIAAISAYRPGQNVTLDVIRGGKTVQMQLTLGLRPENPTTAQNTQPSNPQQPRVLAPVYLGITGQTLTSSLATAAGLPADTKGVVVEQVQAGSPAESAGVQAKDILTAIDGTQVSDVQTVRALLINRQAGDRIALSLVRDGKPLSLTVTLQARP